MKTTVDRIEDFILCAGSDDVGVFGGKIQGGIHIQQVADELARCIYDILEAGTKIDGYLEIGAAAGGTTFIVNRFLTPGKIVLIDDNQHHKHTLRENVLRDINREEIIGLSRDDVVIEAVKKLAPFDMAFIDGDHSYTGVYIDIENYLPMLNKGGFLLLHDSEIGDPWGVPKMVSELMTDKRVEFFGGYVSKKHTPCGIVTFRKVVE